MWSDNETSEDLLGFDVHANLLIDLIDDQTILPVTIGVFGDWGSGKSSVLKIVSEKLGGDNPDEITDGTFVLYFNGWVFEGYDDAKAALLQSIVKAFQDNKTLSTEVKEKAKNLLGSIDWMRAISFGFKNILLPGASALLTGGMSIGNILASQFSKMDKDSLLENITGKDSKQFIEDLLMSNESQFTQVREFRDAFSDMLNASAIEKLVIVIDDLDRCSPERIIENLEAIKLFLNVEKTAFIIGADPRIVRHAIENKYGIKNQQEDQNRIVDDYLEKLIQIPYFLPKLSEPEVETYISMLICKKELSVSNFSPVLTAFKNYRESDRYSAFGLSNIEHSVSAQDFENIKNNVITIPTLVPLITQSLYGNPRQIKRFLNTYTLRIKLAKVASLADFNDAVLAKLMILEYTELQLFKKMFEWQLINNGFPEQIKELENLIKDRSESEALEELQNQYKDWSKPQLVKWLNMEPRLSSVDLRDYFWISREKISSSISGISLIPPVVRSLLNDLLQELPIALTNQIIDQRLSALTPNELSIFIDLLSQTIKRDHKNKRTHQLFTLLIEKNINGVPEQYIESLKVINIGDLEPSIGSMLNVFKEHEIIGTHLKKIFAPGNTSKAAKAFNLN